MDAMECLLSRRSVRRFNNDPVPEGDLKKMLEAVRFAPTWANTQCVELVVVTRPEIKKALQETLSQGNPGRKGIEEAPVVIALVARRNLSGLMGGQFATVHGDWYMFDGGIAAQNLCLAAHALGYGTVHIGLLDHQDAARILGLPDEIALLELIPIGRPAKQPSAPKRKELSEWVHQEKW